MKWSDFITNAEVYTRSGLLSIQSIVRRRRLSLFCHVARMPDNVPAKAVLRVACEVRDGVPYPSQTGADHGAVLLSPGRTRFVQTVVCPLETPSTALRIGSCGERTLRPPRPRVDDDDDDILSRTISELSHLFFIFWTLCVFVLSSLWGLRDNVRCSSWAHWKARSGLPISVN